MKYITPTTQMEGINKSVHPTEILLLVILSASKSLNIGVTIQLLIHFLHIEVRAGPSGVDFPF